MSNMIVFNVQGMDPSARSVSRWKINALRDLVNQTNGGNSMIPIISLTETWLKPYMPKAQINIPNYNIFRADRRSRTRGGAMLYIHEYIPISKSDKFDDL